MSLKERAAITGVGETAYSRNSGKSVVALQMEAVLTDIGADAIKTGMLGTARIVKMVAGTCQALAPSVPIVVKCESARVEPGITRLGVRSAAGSR